MHQTKSWPIERKYRMIYKVLLPICGDHRMLSIKLLAHGGFLTFKTIMGGWSWQGILFVDGVAVATKMPLKEKVGEVCLIQRNHMFYILYWFWHFDLCPIKSIVVTKCDDKHGHKRLLEGKVTRKGVWLIAKWIERLEMTSKKLQVSHNKTQIRTGKCRATLRVCPDRNWESEKVHWSCVFVCLNPSPH